MTAGRTLVARLGARLRASDTFRRWALRSTARCGKGVSDEIRRRQRTEIDRRWRRIAGMLAVAASISVGLALLAPAGPLFRGLTAGAFFASACWIAFHTVAVSSGVAWREYGVEAERWTTAALRPRPWRTETFLVNAVPLDRGDIDHVLITPRGVLAVETKWTSNPWDARAADIAVFGAQLRARADRLAKILASRGAKVPVDCVLVLWGAQGSGLPSVAGVPVVPGSDLRTFLDATGSVTEPVDAEAVWRALAGYVEMRDDYEDRKRVGLKSFQHLAGESAVAVVAVFVAVLFAALLSDVPGVFGTVLCVLGLAAVAVGVRSSWRRVGRHVGIPAGLTFAALVGPVVAEALGRVA